MGDADAQLSDERERHRYEIRLDDRLAGFATYRTLDDRVIALVHTETMDGFVGQGVASRLVTYALDDLRARGLMVRPDCPYVQSYLVKHPEYADLVA